MKFEVDGGFYHIDSEIYSVDLCDLDLVDLKESDVEKESTNGLRSENWFTRLGMARFGDDHLRLQMVNDESWLIRLLCVLYGKEPVWKAFEEDNDWRVQLLLRKLGVV